MFLFSGIENFMHVIWDFFKNKFFYFFLINTYNDGSKEEPSLKVTLITTVPKGTVFESHLIFFGK